MSQRLRNTRPIRAILTFLFLVVGCVPALGQVINLGRAVYRGPQADGTLVAFAVEEWTDATTDLNGDGDVLDEVLHVYDVATDTTINLGLALQLDPQISGSLVAFVVSEADQGNTDLNGDGDAADRVVHTYHAGSGVTTNLGLATWYGLHHGDLFSKSMHGNLVAFRVREADQGNTDLNGDGDHDDYVFHVHDAASGAIVNLGLAGVDSTGRQPVVKGNRVFFVVYEASQGLTDLNGDADIIDEVVHVYDHSSSNVINLALALGGRHPRVAGNLAAFTVDEAAQGGNDLNGDGDPHDQVIHVYDAASGVITNLGRAVVWGYELGVGANRVIFLVNEHGQCDTDLNGDGDHIDDVVHVYEATSGNVSNLGLAALTPPLIRGNLMAFRVHEQQQGASDLNGDEDADDFVVHVHDGASGMTTNLGQAGYFSESVYPDNFRQAWIEGNLLAFEVDESDQGETDLNGDGDPDDVVAHLYDAASGATSNLALAAPGAAFVGPRLAAGRVAFRVPEAAQGNIDLNGDGDTSDIVLHLIDPCSGAGTTLGLATANPFPTVLFHDFKLTEDLAAFVVDESKQGTFGTDLNGDGDTTDRVIHVARPSGLGSVNTGAGPVADVLRINGHTGSVTVPTGAPIEISLDVAPLGPDPAKYVLWVWQGLSTNPVSLVVGSSVLGCMVNPTPLHPDQTPQPILCIRGNGIPPAVSNGVNEKPGPAMAPWVLMKGGGLSNPAVFTFQVLIRDAGAANATGFSVTNAVILKVL